MNRLFTAALAILCLTVLLGSTRPADADWPPEGVLVCQTCDASSPRVVADGTGGAFIAWEDRRSGNDDVYVQHLTASGEVAPNWPRDGIPVCTEPSAQFPGIHTGDGLGGIILVWADLRNAATGGTSVDIYAQRILADGTIASGWPVGGAPVSRSPDYQWIPWATPDMAGGAFVTWDDLTTPDVFLQHMSADGEVAPGWPADGMPICALPSSQGTPQVVSDGSGGALVAWYDNRDGQDAAYAQRVTAMGELSPGWAENGVRIVLGRAFYGLVSDGAGGAYLSCATVDVGDDDYYVQRLTGDGVIAAGWPADGALVCMAPGLRYGIRIVTDRFGGALVAWYDYRDPHDDEIYAFRMRANGTPEPGWPVDGLRVTNNDFFDSGPEMAVDQDGGAYICWDRYSSAMGDRVAVQHLSGAASPAPGWPIDGREIPSDMTSNMMQIDEDEQGGAIVAWQTWDGTTGKIRALRFAADGPVAVGVSLVSAEPEVGRVRLTWYAGGKASLVATVERRTDVTEWERFGTITPDGTGALTYEDREVASGVRYAYRLSYLDGAEVAHTSEVWVTVPIPRFALRGPTPNPSAGDPLVAFTLGSGEPATLELFDIRGRLVHSRAVDEPGVGEKAIRLDGRTLAAGVYTLRLRQGPNIATTRAVIVR